jgi:hypothetical protein
MLMSCYDIQKNLEDLVNEYNTRKNFHEKVLNSYNNYINCKNGVICEGDYAKYSTDLSTFRNEKKDWNNCILWTGIHEIHNDWCERDFGEGWKQVIGSGHQSNCAWGQGKNKCKRTDNQIKKELNVSPTVIIDGKKVVHGESPPPKFHDLTIKQDIACCQSQTFEKIDGKNITIKDIDNKCEINIGENQTNSTNENQTSSINEDQSTLYVTIVVIISIIIFLITSSFFVYYA